MLSINNTGEFAMNSVYGELHVANEKCDFFPSEENQHTRELISAQNMSHKDKNKDLSYLQALALLSTN